MLIVLFSLSLVLFALWLTWPEENMRWIAFTLLASITISNIVHFYSNPNNIPGAYTMTEMFVATAAYVTWEYHRSRWQIILGFLTAISITANIARASIAQPDRMQINLHEGITNIIFILECLTTIGMGINYGIRTGHFSKWPGLRHETSQSNGQGSWKA